MSVCLCVCASVSLFFDSRVRKWKKTVSQSQSQSKQRAQAKLLLLLLFAVSASMCRLPKRYRANTSRTNVPTNVHEVCGMLPACASRLINRANSGTNLKPVYMQHGKGKGKGIGICIGGCSSRCLMLLIAKASMKLYVLRHLLVNPMLYSTMGI